MKNLLDLANTTSRISKNLEKSVSQYTCNVVSLLLRDLIDITPVDTSRLLSNWQISLGSPESHALDAYFEGDFGSTVGPSSEYAYEVGVIILKTRTNLSPIYISNLTPYAVSRDKLGSNNVRKVAPNYTARTVSMAKSNLKNIRFKLIR